MKKKLFKDEMTVNYNKNSKRYWSRRAKLFKAMINACLSISYKLP